MDIKESSQLKTTENRMQLFKDSTNQSCLTILNKLATLKPVEAWHQGTNVRTAMKCDEVTTFAALYAITKDMLDYLEMNKTLRTQEEIQHAVSVLLNEFPAYKLEEWKIVMDRFKAGSIFLVSWYLFSIMIDLSSAYFRNASLSSGNFRRSNILPK